MTTLFVHFDCSALDNAIDLVSLALYSQANRLFHHRRDLQDRRDDLHDLCTSMAADGADELFEDFYYALSDGLAMLTLAVSGRAVNARHLADALSALRLAKEKAVCA